MNYALVVDNGYGSISGLGEVDFEDGVATIKSLDVFCGANSNEVWKSEFAKSIFERPISFHDALFDQQHFYGIVLNKYERDRLWEMFTLLPSYVRFLELGKLPK